MEEANPFKKRAEEEKRKRQAAAEAKAVELEAKAKAKAADKKKAAQAVEDAWYRDGAADNQDDESPRRGAAAGSDSDDDMGFRMFTTDQLSSGVAGPRRSDRGKFKVVNLIDFGECDVLEEGTGPSPPRSAQEAASSSSSLFPPAPAAPGSAAFAPQLMATRVPLGSLSLALPGAPSNLGGMVPSFGAARGSFGSAAVAAVPPPPPPPSEGALLAEIEHLRQMLADAAEEKAIQVEIVRDEVADKQRALDALRHQQSKEAEALSRLKEQLVVMEAERLADRESLRATRAESEDLRAEVGRLREASAAAASTASSLDSAEQKGGKGITASERVELQQLRDEVLQLRQAEGTQGLLAELRVALAGARAELGGSREPVAATQAPPREGSLEAQLVSLRDTATAVQACAARMSVARKQTLASRQNLEAAQALREVRQNSERQLAWMMKRVRIKSNVSADAPGYVGFGMDEPQCSGIAVA